MDTRAGAGDAAVSPASGAATVGATSGAVAAVRAFNRFYTNEIGVLHSGLLDSRYTLTEARILFELAHCDPAEAASLRQAVDIDAGYLSRILARFESSGLVTRERLAGDGRRQAIRLTAAGRAAFADLDTRSAEQVAGQLARLSPADLGRLTGAMRTVEEVLGGKPLPRAYLLRPPRPGDLGWVVHRHGAGYAAEHGWDASFEALVAEIVAGYANGHDPRREAAWIAEVDGQPVGSVFCMRAAQDTAQLRLLLVEPAVRGLGIGSRLIAECVAFARQAGYRQITLWTQDALVQARRLYQRAGFTLTSQSPHHSFGHDLVAETWSLPLAPAVTE